MKQIWGAPSRDNQALLKDCYDLQCCQPTRRTANGSPFRCSPRWAMFPIGAGSKTSLVERWPDVATSNLHQLELWFDEFPLCNWGLVTGAASGLLELFEKLRKEWPGILQWMVEGCIQWQSVKLQAPKTVREATATYFAAEDVISRWIEERCEVNSKRWASSTILFKDWSKWCEDNGENVGSQRRFSEALETRGFKTKRTNAFRGFVGIGLVTDVTHHSI
jgi:hypothetical protein